MTASPMSEVAPAYDDPVRDRLIKAAHEVLLCQREPNPSMEQFAKAAHLSRATAYRYFCSRDELILEVALRRAGSYLDRFRELIKEKAGFEEKFEHGFTYLILTLPKDPAIALLLRLSAESKLDPRAARLALDTMHPLLLVARDRGEVRGDLPIDEMVAWLVTTFTDLMLDRRWAPHEVRHHIRNFVLPVLRPQRAAPPERAIEHDPDDRLRRIEDRLDALVDSVATLADRIRE